jgi:hypothetical protein
MIRISYKLTVGGVVFQEIDDIINLVEVIDGHDSEFVWVVDSMSEHESTNSTKSVDSKFH